MTSARVGGAEPIVPVIPLSEAITTEIPKMRPKEHRPFDPGFFILAVDVKGPRTVCFQCGAMCPDPFTNLGAHLEFAQGHWREKHT